MPNAELISGVLLRKGLLTNDQLHIAKVEQQTRNKSLGKVLVSLGFVTEGMLRDALGEALKQESIDLASVVPDGEAIALIPIDMAKRYQMVPVSFHRETQRLTVAMADTLDVIALDQVTAWLGGDKEVHAVLAGEGEVARAIDQFYGFELSLDGILQEIETGEIDPRDLAARTDEYSHPVVRLVDALISDAVKQGASDIHFEPEHSFLRIRYRVDGLLRQARCLHTKYWSAIAVRLKVMATLNIAETRAPQDGRITLTLHGRTIDFRISSLPTLHGENMVLRILDRQKGIIPLDQLGLSDAALATLRLMMARPEGIILVTGPTGSGKTTTLYSILSVLDFERTNIMTLEDPVEFPMTGIRQSAVNDATRLDFANGVRAILRQDPDVILVGEIRDQETAEMALRAAITGHQVYATLHAPSALGSVPRLVDLGVRPDTLAGNVIGVVAQRLVRKLCVHCREGYGAGERERHLLGERVTGAPTLWRAIGCPQCDGEGYKGRIALMEVVRFDEQMDDLVARQASPREVAEAAMRMGFRSLAEEGIGRALAGVTSLEEVARVVDLMSRQR